MLPDIGPTTFFALKIITLYGHGLYALGCRVSDQRRLMESKTTTEAEEARVKKGETYMHSWRSRVQDTRMEREAREIRRTRNWTGFAQMHARNLISRSVGNGT